MTTAPAPVAERHLAQAIVCTTDRRTVSCRSAAPVIAPSHHAAAVAALAAMHTPVVEPSQPAVVFGGNGTRFDLRLDLSVSLGTIIFFTQLENTLGQSMGTLDGVTADIDGIRVGLINDPVALAGTGVIAPEFTAGTAAFGVPDRPYWQVSNDILRAGDRLSSSGLIGFTVPTTVQRFEFRLLLSAALADESESGLRPLQAGFDNFAIGPFGGCGTRPDGRMWCWGRNDEGQMGAGFDAAGISFPGDVVNRGTSIALGQYHLCTSDVLTFRLSCIGSNGAGQLGLAFGSFYSELFTSSFPPVAVTELSGGGENTCGLDLVPRVVCWGDNRFGQLARDPGTTRESGSPLVITPPAGVTFTRVFVGRAGTICALSATDLAYCWGRNDAGQVGNSAQPGPPVLTPSEVAGGRTWRTLVIGDRHACGIALADGAVWCWGDGSRRQLGVDLPSSAVPVTVPNLPPAESISAGADFTCIAAFSDGVRCWGRNDDGQLGTGTISAPSLPQPSQVGAGSWVQVAAGARHACARQSSGIVACWGDNRQGQLTLDRGTGRSATPVQVSGGVGAEVRLVGGHETTCLATPIDAGTFDFRCFGSGAGMQVRFEGRSGVQGGPIGVRSGERWLSVGVGEGHACGLNMAGIPYCWGRGHAGQLGTERLQLETTPQRVDVGETFRSLAVGYDHACAIRETDRRVMCWGRNDFNQLGDGTTINRTAPVPIASTVAFVRVAAGPHHTCGISDVGAMWCWGANAAGQVGDGTTVNAAVPVQVLSPFQTDLALGGDGDPATGFTCALGETVSCWGHGSDGQLGNGTTASQRTPLTAAAVVSAVANPFQLAAGRAHACALSNTQSNVQLWCWGASADGQVEAALSVQRTLTPVAPQTFLSAPPTRVVAAADRTCFESGQRWYCYGGRNMLGELGIDAFGRQNFVGQLR